MDNENKIFSWIIYLSVVAVLVLFALQKVWDADVWLHMSLGKYMVQHRTLPSTDVFTFTGYGNPYEYVEWLFQVFLYLIYYLAGYNGLMIFKLGLWLVCMLVIWQWMKLEGVEPRWAAFFTIFPAFLLAVRWRERPELVGYFCLILYIWVLSRYRYRGRNYFYFLPLAQIIWVNSHPSALLGVMIYGVILLGEGADYLWDKNKRDLRVIKALAIMVPVLAGVSIINPYGYKSLILPYLYATDKNIQTSIAEWLPIWRFSYIRNIYLCLAVPAVLSFIPRFIHPRKNLKISDLLLFLSGLVLPGLSIRYMSFFALIALPLAGKNIYWFLSSPDGLQEWWQSRQPRLVRLRWVLPALVLILGLVLFGLSPRRGLGGWGLQRYAVPEQALAFIIENRLPGRIFNKYDWGGYINFKAYPYYLPFIDSRAGLGDVTGSEIKVLRELAVIEAARPGWEKILERRGVNLIMTSSMDSRGIVWPLVLELLKNPDWLLIWNQEASLIFLRNLPENQYWLQKYTIPKTKVFDEVILEARYMIKVQKITDYTYYSLGWAYLMRGNFAEAKTAYQEHLKVIPDDPAARNYLDWLIKQGY